MSTTIPNHREVEPTRLAWRLRGFADAVGVSERTAWGWTQLQDDPLPVVKIGQTLLIPTESAREWLERRASAKKTS